VKEIKITWSRFVKTCEKWGISGKVAKEGSKSTSLIMFVFNRTNSEFDAEAVLREGQARGQNLRLPEDDSIHFPMSQDRGYIVKPVEEARCS
jgi:hypothetical protein